MENISLPENESYWWLSWKMRELPYYIYLSVSWILLLFFSWLSLPTEAIFRESKKEEKIIERMDSNLSNSSN